MEKYIDEIGNKGRHSIGWNQEFEGIIETWFIMFGAFKEWKNWIIVFVSILIIKNIVDIYQD